jgi:AraC-like DNA-binding protein
MAVVAGACWLTLDSNDDRRRVREGDLIVIRGEPYTLASDIGVAPMDALQVFTDLQVKVVTVGIGNDFVAIGGHVTLDPERGWMLGDALPSLIHIDSGASAAPVMRFLLEQLVAEVGSDRPGASLTAEQLAQLLFVQILRSHLSISGALTRGWIRVLADPRLAPALRLMHQEPGHSWRLEELARSVAMSRTNFAVRFKEAAGMAPLAYLASWRMRLAQHRLKETSIPVATLAATLGYTSESAFSNAFKRSVGVSPARYRSTGRKINETPPAS